MLIKSLADEIQSYLVDSSNLLGGHADEVLFPETAEEIAEILSNATRDHTPVTVAGAGTGIVGGRVPFGGIVIATDRLKRIGEIIRRNGGGTARVQAGVVLSDFQKFVESHGLLYPPDPTERSCFLGGTVATNASGARTFKYGPTRDYVEKLKIVLASGDILDLSRGELYARDRLIQIPLANGRTIEAMLPSYRMPDTRKNASGYYVAPDMDLIDLFIGSEGTLGVIAEIETRLLPKPLGVFAGIIFFAEEDQLVLFVREARAASLKTRSTSTTGIDARAIEFFDRRALNFLRDRYNLVPVTAEGAVFFEQEVSPESEDRLVDGWLELISKYDGMEESWIARQEGDQNKLREFRHALPVMLNEWLARHGQRKIGTDMAVPDEQFSGWFDFYRRKLESSNLNYVLFGHIGDNHVHANILPRDEVEAQKARELYVELIERVVEFGGTVSAEHGIGKIKREYLAMLYGEKHLREMAELKKAFDPACILGRGNMIAEEYL